MRKLLAALIIATGVASPAAATAVKETAMATSSIQQVQYHEGYTRHGFVKCYRFLVFGHYRCHYYRDF